MPSDNAAAAKRRDQPFAVTKSYQDGHVGVRITLQARGYSGASISMQGSTDISVAEARDLATALVQAADEADAKVAKKAAEENRRQKWRDREVAAGRRKVMGVGDFFNDR